MRNPSFTRHLKPTEIELARSVFHNSLPPWSQIGVTDGLGKGMVNGCVWTIDKSWLPFPQLADRSIQYFLNFGDAANIDLSSPAEKLATYVAGYGPQTVAEVFIHELTHVWQFERKNSALAALRCLYAQKIGAGYKVALGDPWDDYNLEQQAEIVRIWYAQKQKEDDPGFPYIHYIIRNEGPYRPTKDNDSYSEEWFAKKANLAQLKVLLDMERMRLSDEIKPVQIRTMDDSLIVILKDDVLFDFDKSVLKPAADGPLEQAWNAIKSNPRRRLVYIEGYTDDVGDDNYNNALSEQRAKSVAQWFIRRRYLTPPDVKTLGFGKAKPAAPNATPEGRARNRRVEIRLQNS